MNNSEISLKNFADKLASYSKEERIERIESISVTVNEIKHHLPKAPCELRRIRRLLKFINETHFKDKTCQFRKEINQTLSKIKVQK